MGGEEKIRERNQTYFLLSTFSSSPSFSDDSLGLHVKKGESRLRFTALPNGDKTLALSWKPVVICDPGNKEAH